MKPRQPSANQPGECIFYLDTGERSPSRPPRWGRGFRRGRACGLAEGPSATFTKELMDDGRGVKAESQAGTSRALGSNLVPNQRGPGAQIRIVHIELLRRDEMSALPFDRFVNLLLSSRTVNGRPSPNKAREGRDNSRRSRVDGLWIFLCFSGRLRLAPGS